MPPARCCPRWRSPSSGLCSGPRRLQCGPSSCRCGRCLPRQRCRGYGDLCCILKVNGCLNLTLKLRRVSALLAAAVCTCVAVVQRVGGCHHGVPRGRRGQARSGQQVTPAASTRRGGSGRAGQAQGCTRGMGRMGSMDSQGSQGSQGSQVASPTCSTAAGWSRTGAWPALCPRNTRPLHIQHKAWQDFSLCRGTRVEAWRRCHACLCLS